MFDVDVGALDVVVEVADEVVDEIVVVVVDVVVEVAVKSGVIANPQPCDGSFSASGSETGNWDDVEPDGGEVVVVTVGVPDGSVEVVVVDKVVVEDEADVFLESSSLVPVSRSARSITERITRNGQRRWGRAFAELRISLLR